MAISDGKSLEFILDEEKGKERVEEEEEEEEEEEAWSLVSEHSNKVLRERGILTLI